MSNYSTYSSNSALNVSKTALSLIGDIKAVERAFNALAVQANDLGLKRNENEGDIAFLGRIAAAASELSHDLRKKEDAETIKRQIEGQAAARRKGLSGLLDRAADAVARF
jgi:hypothetical protein